MSQVELAKKAGVSQTTIADIERGRNEGSKHLVDLARALACSVEWLATGKGDMRANSNNRAAGVDLLQNVPLRGRVPVISLVAASDWSEAVDNFAPGVAEEWIETTVAVRRHTYALRVQGDSMEPKFPNGSTIIVEPEEGARNGSFVIVRQNGGEATFKQLVYDGGQAFLRPLNDRYPIMPMKPDAVICGVVKQMIMDV